MGLTIPLRIAFVSLIKYKHRDIEKYYLEKSSKLKLIAAFI
jgi:hypothetical protein